MGSGGSGVRGQSRSLPASYLITVPGVGRHSMGPKVRSCTQNCHCCQLQSSSPWVWLCIAAKLESCNGKRQEKA
jgi:hypothetical protein